MSNKRINKAYVRYDGSGRVIPGALLLNRFKPTGGGKWHEIPAYECCNPVPVLAFRILFDDIANANTLVGDASNVSDWNTFFNLPANGNPFISVVVVGNEVQLIGGSDIMLNNGGDYTNNLFSGNQHIIRVEDSAGCITGFGEGVFYDAVNLEWVEFVASNINFDYASYILGSDYTQNLAYVSFPNITLAYDSVYTYGVFSFIGFSGDSVDTVFNLPSLTSVARECFSKNTSFTTLNLPSVTNTGPFCFQYCSSLTSINLPSCTNLGGTVGDDGIFNNISGSIITLTIPSALMTCDAGNPDGDIQYLQANNTVTIVTV